MGRNFYDQSSVRDRTLIECRLHIRTIPNMNVRPCCTLSRLPPLHSERAASPRCCKTLLQRAKHCYTATHCSKALLQRATVTARRHARRNAPSPLSSPPSWIQCKPPQLLPSPLACCLLHRIPDATVPPFTPTAALRRSAGSEPGSTKCLSAPTAEYVDRFRFPSGRPTKRHRIMVYKIVYTKKYM